MDNAVRGRLLQLAAEDQVHAAAAYDASQRVAEHRGRFLFDIPRAEWLPEYLDAERRAVDRLAELRSIVLELRGRWPGRSSVGEDGARAAWLLAQHAGSTDRELQGWFESLLSDAVDEGEARPGQLAALRDRIELEAGRPQLYGTHLEPDSDGGSWRPVRGLDDETAVDARRGALGLQPWRSYLADCLRGVTET
jgi:hypothetical protein